jgi:hypothetical protein
MVIVTTCCGGLTHMSRRLRASQAVICLNVAARASLGRARSQAQRVVPSPQGRAPRPYASLSHSALNTCPPVWRQNRPTRLESHQ